MFDSSRADPAYPSSIGAAAGRLAACSSELHTDAALLERASTQCPWDGAGARAFRRRQGDATTHLRRSADRLDEVVRLLYAHSAAVAEAIVRGR